MASSKSSRKGKSMKDLKPRKSDAKKVKGGILLPMKVQDSVRSVIKPIKGQPPM